MKDTPGSAWRHIAGRLLCLLFLCAGPVISHEGMVTFHPFQLTNWNGETVTLESLEGKTAIVVFTYARCAFECPLVTTYLKDLDREIGSPDAIRYVHISVNPADDTDEEARKHFLKFGIDPVQDPRWLFLVGPADGIEACLIDNGISVRKRTVPGGFLIQHEIRVNVLDSDGHIVETFDTYLWDKEKMLNAVKRSLPSR